MLTKLPERRSIRLKGYDYAHPGVYFVTICTGGKRCTLGRVAGDRVELFPLGRIVRECWLEIPRHRGRVELDAFVVMPNHFHALVIQHAVPGPRARQVAPLQLAPRLRPDTLGAVIHAFKAAVTRRARRELGITGAVWQRSYYEHVVRNGDDLVEIQNYIQMNPLRWAFDRENPDCRNEPDPQL